MKQKKEKFENEIKNEKKENSFKLIAIKEKVSVCVYFHLNDFISLLLVIIIIRVIKKSVYNCIA